MSSLGRGGLYNGPVVLSSGLDNGPVLLSSGLYNGPVLLSSGLYNGPVLLSSGLDRRMLLCSRILYYISAFSSLPWMHKYLMPPTDTETLQHILRGSYSTLRHYPSLMERRLTITPPTGDVYTQFIQVMSVRTFHECLRFMSVRTFRECSYVS